MKIRTRFVLSSAIFVAILAILSLSMLATYRKAHNLWRQVDLAVRIEREAGDLAYLCSDYLVFQEGGQLRRLESGLARIKGDMAELRLEDARLDAVADRILAGLARFERVLGSAPTADQDHLDPESFRAEWSRAAVQNQEIVSQAEQLLLMTQSKARSMDRASGILAFLCLLSFGVYVAAGYAHTRGLLRPIAELERGVAVIGSGDLDFRIRENGPDELAGLAGAFNRMTASLKDATVSRDEMKKAEEQLRRRQAEIQALFDNTPAGLVLFDARPPYTVLVHNRYYQELFAEPFGSRGMVGLNVYQYAPDVEAAGVVAVFDEVVRTKQAKNLLDFPYKSNPPAESWFNWHMTPIMLDGRVVALVSMSMDVTDLHKARESVRKSEDRLALALAAARQGTWDYDVATGTLTASPRMAEICGMPDARSLRTMADWRGLILEDDLPVVDSALSEAYSRDYLEGEYRIRRQTDNAVRWIAAYGRVLRDGQGNPAHVVGVISDITERRRGEEIVRQLAQFPEENPNPVFRIGTDGGVLYANPAGVVLLETLWQWQPGFPFPAGLTQIALAAYGKGRQVEEEISAPQHRALLVSAVRPKGNEYVNVYLRDITARAKAEADLRDSRLAALNLLKDTVEAKKLADEATAAARDSEERLAKAQEIAHLGSWEIDLARNRLTWSRETYRIFGLTPEEFPATYDAFLELVHPDDRKAVDAAYRGSVSEGRPTYEIEHRIVKRSTGEIRVVHERCVHVKDDAGSVARSIGMVHDITERKQAEEEMKRLTESMEQFAYVASHDLQEPLRVMTSYCQLLEARYKDQLDRDGADFIAFVMDGATRMQKLILDLLAYSRIGHRDSPLAKVDCGLLVRQVVSGMAETIESSGAEISVGELPVVRGHESTLTQLFQNLIANALKFHGNAAPRIGISARKDGNAWLFSVRDNGIGIDPRHHDRIFVIFQRLHSRVKYPGTGIGLAICRKVVENHGGTIWVDSQPGKGSTFHFTIPAEGKR